MAQSKNVMPLSCTTKNTAVPQLGTIALYLCRVLGAAAFLPHNNPRHPTAHKNNEDMAAKTMTYHELLHSVTFDEDVNFVPLPRFLIVECNLDY